MRPRTSKRRSPTSRPGCSATRPPCRAARRRNLQANTCPTNTRIGTSRLETYLAGTNLAPPGPLAPLTSLPGTIYNAEPLANEPGRLGIVTPVGATNLVSSIPFYLTPRGSKDYGLTGILSDINRLNPPTLPANLQVARLSFLLEGSSTKYVRNPTSCGSNNNTGTAHGWDDKTIVEGPAYSFTTSGCDQPPFGPSMSFTVGDRGTTRQFGFPPLDVKVSVPNNDNGQVQADIRNNVFTLPIELNSNNPVYKLCNQAQADADACPANSKFGNATATSPFLHEKVGGPIYLIEQPGNTLPGLLLDMYGRVHVKLQVSSKFVNGNQIQSITSDAPQVPITELTLGLNGGRTGGVFQARKDLCFRQGSTSQFRDVMGEYSFVGWNGKATGTKKVRGSVEGCGPAVSPSLSGATGSKPSLKVSVKAHPDSPAMKEVTLKMEDGLSMSCKRVRSGVGGTASANNPLKQSDFRCVNSRTLEGEAPDTRRPQRVGAFAERGPEGAIWRQEVAPPRHQPAPDRQGLADAGERDRNLDQHEVHGQGQQAVALP